MLYITEKCPETKIRNDNSFHNIINLLCHIFSNLSILYILIELEDNTVLNKITSSFITIVIYLFLQIGVLLVGVPLYHIVSGAQRVWGRGNKIFRWL